MNRPKRRRALTIVLLAAITGVATFTLAPPPAEAGFRERYRRLKAAAKEKARRLKQKARRLKARAGYKLWKAATPPGAFRLLKCCYGNYQPLRSRPGSGLARVLKGTAGAAARMLPRAPAGRVKRLGDEMHALLAAQLGVDKNAGQLARVRRIGQRLARVAKLGAGSPRPVQFFVLDDPKVNAITVPGHRIYVFGGLLKRITSDGQLAMVLGHELAHIRLEHLEKRLRGIFLAQKFGPFGFLAYKAFGLVARIYDQENEHDADALGLCLMQQAGFRAPDGVSVTRLLASLRPPPDRRRGRLRKILRDYLKTHPAAAPRLRRIKAWAASLASRRPVCKP